MRSRGDRGHLSIKISSKPPRALCPARRSPLETVEPTKGLDKACNASVTMAVVAEKRPRRRRLRPQPPGGILDLISSGEGGWQKKVESKMAAVDFATMVAEHERRPTKMMN